MKVKKGIVCSRGPKKKPQFRKKNTSVEKCCQTCKKCGKIVINARKEENTRNANYWYLKISLKRRRNRKLLRYDGKICSKRLKSKPNSSLKIFHLRPTLKQQNSQRKNCHTQNKREVKGGTDKKGDKNLKKTRLNKGPLIGLQNLGLTCFLNSVLQAMASCATYVRWLDSCRDQGEVAAALFYLLKVLSTEQVKLPEGVEDPLAPVVLRDALHRHGWIISPSEQDAHELYHLLMVTLEEEAHKSAVAEGGITDALEPKQKLANGDLRVSPVCEIGEHKQNDASMHSDEEGNVTRGPSGDSMKSVSASTSAGLRPGDAMYRKLLPKYDCNRNYPVSPFCGMLTSQLQCVRCNFKSVVRFDKFDSLLLHLPDSPRVQHTLTSLLEGFTGTEAVTGVECEGCNLNRGPDTPPVTSTSNKTLSIGKLPKCLCIHIHRMSMGPNGTIYKRSDYVEFPEFLAMDPYTHNALMKEQKSKEESNSLSSDMNKNEPEELEATKVEEIQPAVENSQVLEIPSTSHDVLPCRTRSQNLYRLQAVVVHRGSAQGGHFVTYRRGPLRSSARLRWYYTSDDVVEESSLAEAMNAVAYMLFYEKYTNT